MALCCDAVRSLQIPSRVSTLGAKKDPDEYSKFHTIAGPESLGRDWRFEVPKNADGGRKKRHSEGVKGLSQWDSALCPLPLSVRPSLSHSVSDTVPDTGSDIRKTPPWPPLTCFSKHIVYYISILLSGLECRDTFNEGFLKYIENASSIKTVWLMTRNFVPDNKEGTSCIYILRFTAFRHA